MNGEKSSRASLPSSPCITAAKRKRDSAQPQAKEGSGSFPIGSHVLKAVAKSLERRISRGTFEPRPSADCTSQSPGVALMMLLPEMPERIRVSIWVRTLAYSSADFKSDAVLLLL